MTKQTIILLLAFMTVFQCFGQSSSNRIALVIGNSKYVKFALKSPENDAKMLADELKNCGFEVILGTNLTINDTKKKIQEFGNMLSKNKGVGFFYYSGHAFQYEGENYILPVDAEIQQVTDIQFEAINLKRIIGEMEYAQNQLNIVIFDANRNNPVFQASKSVQKNGLAPMECPAGFYLVYAAAPGAVPCGMDNERSHYSEALVKYLKVPNLKIEEVFRNVRRELFKKTNGAQSPWETSTFDGEFIFRKE